MTAHKGRGALDNAASRYLEHRCEREDDGWGSLEEDEPSPVTEVTADIARTILSYNDSPDIPFDRSVNPYRGCEHGCIYCYARPSHARYGLSPGLDFETRLAYKPNAAGLLRGELAKRSYRPAPIMVGVNTDAYQPIERRLRLTRAMLEVLSEARHPLVIVTKSALVERDLDLLAPMAEAGLAQVAVSLTTLRPELSRRLEPRAAAPQRRLEAIRRLAGAGIPVSALAAPLIPVLTDGELEGLLAAAKEAGAMNANYILLRLPLELEQLFRGWLDHHEPLAAGHVLSRLRAIRGGRANDSRFGYRMRGTGPYANLIEQRFRLAANKLGFAPPPLRCDLFRPPATAGQLQLF